MKKKSSQSLEKLVSRQQSSVLGNEAKTKGFAKVVAGGRIIRLRNEAPFFQRMVTGNQVTAETDPNHSKVILESISTNLEAGISMVDKQETALAKIGGRLSDIALSLNKARDVNSSSKTREESQMRFESARDVIRKAAIETFDNSALFSFGQAKPVTIAVPSNGQWEGLSVDRANLGQPGLITIDKGKVHGPSEDYMLDPGTIKRAFDEWRSLCVSNRMQHSLLMGRLHCLRQTLHSLLTGAAWKAPKEPAPTQLGPLNRPHRLN
jgi:hypothetical protein